MRRVSLACGLLAAIVVAGCDTPVTDPAPTPEIASARTDAGLSTIVPGDGDLQSFMIRANDALAERGVGMVIGKAEWFGAGPDADAAKIVFANDRQLRLGTRWVPNDPRRVTTGLDLTQGSFAPFQLANGTTPTEGIVDQTFETWNDLRCSKLQVNKTTFLPGIFPSAILVLPPLVNDPFAADISNVGWVPGFIFDLVLGPGASNSVLGVTFTFWWIDGNGDPTDLDGDGRRDTALKEVWYNDNFLWSTDGSGVDIESVVLHENGHALELGHFGKLTAHFDRQGAFKRIQASPRAVMNASYYEPLRSPLGTDNAAMCGNFADWQ